MLPLTHVVYHILVSLTEEPRHGYGIIKDVMVRTDGGMELEAGTLYAAIRRMRDDGLVMEVPPPAGADARRRYYAITDLGRDTARAESRRLESLVTLARDAKLLPAR